MSESIERAWEEAEKLLRAFREDREVRKSMDRAVEGVLECFARGGKILCCGNGGSMCDAMHFAEEWSGRFRFDRKPFPAIALSDPAHMSCVANDYGFAHVFSRQVEALANRGDILLLLSTSGNSENIVKAAAAARERGALVYGFLGKGGGAVLPYCDVAILAPGDGSDRIQELHMLALHSLIEACEIELGFAENLKV